MDAERVADRVEAYLEIPAVVGFERPFTEHLAAEFGARGLDVERRPGVLIARGGDDAGVVSAHIDRHGLVLRGGVLVYAATLARARYGAVARPGARAREAICARFDREPVYAYDPATGRRLASGTIRHDHLCGMDPASLTLEVDGLDGVADGTPVAYSHRCARVEGRLTGQLDNVVSAAIVSEAFDAGFAGTALLTTEEEAGRSWEHLRDWFEQAGPRRDLIVLDTSPFGDPGPVDAGVVVLRHRDASAAFDPAAVGRLEDAARAVGAPVVFKDEVLAAAGEGLGRTELGRLVEGTGGAVSGATIQLATTDYHSNEESASLLGLQHLLDVLGRALTLGRG